LCLFSTIDGKPVSKKGCKIFVGASNLVVTLSSFVESSNKIEILKLEAQKETIEQAMEKFLNAQVQIVTIFVNVLKPKVIKEED
jgi:hypothetical protein